MAREDGKYWVDKKRFYEEIVEHRKAQGWKNSKEQDNPDAPMPNYVAQSIMNIANGVMLRYNFNKYSYRDEMVSDAIITIIKYYNTFNIQKSQNPYGYFWLAAYRSGVRRLGLEKDQQAIRAKTIQHMFVDDDVFSQEEFEEFHNYMNDFVSFDLDAYEESKKKKRKKPVNNEEEEMENESTGI
jgi:hypothetical protein